MMPSMRRIQVTLAAIAITACTAIAPAAASAATGTFSNATPVVGPSAPDLGKASPSPSSITVSGMTGVITDVNVFLNGVNAANSDDIDALLEAPFGQTTMLLSDAGGNTGSTNLTIALNDESVAPAPDSSVLASQGYKPTDYGTNLMDAPGLDPMLNPEAPSPPYGLTLSLSDGTDPNGVWDLYVNDDFNNNNPVGFAGGWTISITTTDVPPPVNAPPVVVTPAVVATPTTKKKCKKGKRLVGKKCKKKKKKK
jgi:hypothetical protein